MKMRLQRHYLSSFVALLTVCSFMPTYATSLQSSSDINRAIKQFVVMQQVPLDNIFVTLTSLNSQLSVPQCNRQLQIRIAPGTKLMGHTTFSVSCASPQKWKIHVAAHIDGKVDVLVARYPLPRGTQIQEEQLEYVNRRYSQLNYSYYTSVSLLANMEARRNIKAGQVITPRLVNKQKLVLRGQHITIVAQNGLLNMRVKGKALMDGRHGQTIKVRNLNSKKMIYARVISAGIVKVNF